MRITTKGQVTIPQTLREQFGFLPHTEVEFVEHQGLVVLQKKYQKKKRLAAWLSKAKGSAKTSLTTDEILQLTRGED